MPKFVSADDRPDHEVVIVGAGFAGIGAAIKLGERGIDYIVLEASDGVGGTWHHNTYPGVAVDIPSFSYSFSFEQNRRWSRTYAPGAELKAYADHCVDKYDIRRRIRFNLVVANAAFDDDTNLWRLTTTAGDSVTARYFIYALGPFGEPALPDIRGIETFEGAKIHTARWDHTQDLTGRRVAVIGTGASAVQVVPAIAPKVGKLTVFQRTPIWVLPRVDVPLSGAAHVALRRVPLLRPVARLLSQGMVETTFVIAAQYNATVPWLVSGSAQAARRFMRSQVKDPVVREKLMPQYPLGCKRPSFSNTYLAAYNRSNVTLETDPIAEITPTGVRTASGHEHAVDTLILATGFKLFGKEGTPSFTITGSGGTDLGNYWDENRYQAFQGVSVPRFPNMFAVMGPYGFNGSSYFNLIEGQVGHILRCITTGQHREVTRIEVTQAAHDAYYQRMLSQRGRQVFFNQDCSNANSYYFDQHGDAPFRSDNSAKFRWDATHFDIESYTFA